MGLEARINMSEQVIDFADWKRTHTCGELSARDEGQEIKLNGWVHRYRDLGGLIFIDLRDRYGITQVVFKPEVLESAQMDVAGKARAEFVLAISGKVECRPDGTVNKDLGTGDIEITVTDFVVLNTSKTPPFEVEDQSSASEDLRLRYRYLDLRRGPMRDRMILRHRFAKAVRDWFDGAGFLEIETPLLIRSTPEGARDYVVPSRVQKGRFYALPQSPQLLKQILMVSGFDRYFQLARCLRDEDLRSDRQPEHTQIDVEMSFVTQDDVFNVVERMMTHAFDKAASIEISSPFPRFTYEEVMNRYGSDKPDTRFGLEIFDVSDVFADTEFQAFSGSTRSGGTVRGLCVPGGGSMSRKEFDGLTELARSAGAKGLVWLAREEDGVRGPAAKFLSESELSRLWDAAGCGVGDLVLIVADFARVTLPVLGRLRLHLGKKLELIDTSRWNFLWVTDFPMFEFKPDAGRYDAMHNIVSSPASEDETMLEDGFTSELQLGDPAHPWSLVKANQYDLVLNGSELASGGIRINRSGTQRKVLNILGISDERAERMFGFLLESLDFGAPPHGGIALGLDRILALIAGTDSIRDVIAFPKTTQAQSLMDGAPTLIEAEQLAELGLVVRPPSADTSSEGGNRP
jgi:aspartyl-tRNA synthetase